MSENTSQNHHSQVRDQQHNQHGEHAGHGTHGAYGQPAPAHAGHVAGTMPASEHMHRAPDVAAESHEGHATGTTEHEQSAFVVIMEVHACYHSNCEHLGIGHFCQDMVFVATGLEHIVGNDVNGTMSVSFTLFPLEWLWETYFQAGTA